MCHTHKDNRHFPALYINFQSITQVAGNTGNVGNVGNAGNVDNVGNVGNAGNAGNVCVFEQ